MISAAEWQVALSDDVVQVLISDSTTHQTATKAMFELDHTKRFWFLGEAVHWIASLQGSVEDRWDAATQDLFNKLDTEIGFVATAYPTSGPDCRVRSPVPQEIWSTASTDRVHGSYVSFLDDEERSELGGHLVFLGRDWYGARVERADVLRLWPASGLAGNGTAHPVAGKTWPQTIDNIEKALNPRAKAQRATLAELKILIAEGLDKEASEDAIVAKLKGRVLKPNKVGNLVDVDARVIRMSVHEFLKAARGE